MQPGLGGMFVAESARRPLEDLARELGGKHAPMWRLLHCAFQRRQSRTECAVMKSLFDVSGKVAVVTGGSRGIGAMIARGFVENGMRVYISSRKAEACDAMAAELSQYGECVSFPHDLSGLNGINTFVQELSEREEKLDVLVNNAGAVWAAPIDEFPEHAWNKVMDINIKSPFFLTQKCLPLLRKSAQAEDPARVIMVASIDGLHVNPMETYPYAASKSGLIHLTRALTARLSQEHITVNAIAPGRSRAR